MKQIFTTLGAVIMTIIANPLLAQWQSIGSGIATSQRSIFSISAVNENTVWALGTHPLNQASYDFTLTVDGGSTWNAGVLPTPQQNYFVGYIHAISAETAWVLMVNTPQQTRTKIFRTLNGGSSWEEQPGEFNESGFAFAALHFFNANEGIGFGSPGTGDPQIDSLRIYRTSDGGDNWYRIPASSLPDPLDNEGVWVFGDNRYETRGDTLWFVTRASRVFRTTDRGQTWDAFDAGITGNASFPGLASIAFQNPQQGIVTTYLPSRAAITSDGGESWTEITIPFTPNAADIEYVPGTLATYIVNRAYTNAGSSSTYLITNDGGSTWYTATYSPAVPVVKFLSPTVGFAGGVVNSPTDGGVYRWTGDLSDPVSMESLSGENAKIDLYPNPASETITVRNLSRTSLVRILNLNGQTIFSSTVVNNQLTINTTDFANGMYIIQVTQDGQVSQAKFMVNH